MASVVKDPRGFKRIVFTDASGQRRALRLGKCAVKQAESIKLRVEAIVQDQRFGRTHDGELARWIIDLGPSMQKRMRRVTLIGEGATRNDMKLGMFLDKLKSAMSGKQSTKTFYGHTIRNLREFFGAARVVRSIGTQGGDEFRAWLKADQELAETTISRRIIAARTIFKRASRWKLLDENPFTDVKAGQQLNESRKFFVTREMTHKIFDHCPDAEWKLIVALSRFGGLRCPSEHMLLRWSDIDDVKMFVRSPKTEHHRGGDFRYVPLFPELKPFLDAVRADADPDVEFVIVRRRHGSNNLRTRLCRIIEDAGMKPWPKVFHNMRSSRQTELVDSGVPEHVACAWLGNSERVARKHYLQLLDQHFDQAARIAALTPTVGDGQQQTGKIMDDENRSVKSGDDKASPLLAGAGSSNQWAIQARNKATKPARNHTRLPEPSRNPARRNAEKRKPNLNRAFKRIRAAIASPLASAVAAVEGNHE